MARVFITGSADGLGRLAAQTLLDDRHEVVVNVRNSDRVEAVGDLSTAARRSSSETWPTPSRRAVSPATWIASAASTR